MPYGLERDPIRCVQAHGNQGTVAEIASIAQRLLNDGRAVLGITVLAQIGAVPAGTS